MDKAPKPNEMAYNGYHLFHYTSLESAIRIILTKSLRFGEFANMNDIAEIRKESFGYCEPEIMLRVLSKYRAISLTFDKVDNRGFAINTLWGYYADKGRGACLVFNKERLLNEYRQLRCDGMSDELYINYLSENSNALFLEGNTEKEIEEYVNHNIADIFYTKDKCWEHEQELRLLVKSDKDVSLSISDSLIGAIICVPKEDEYKESIQYKLLEKLQQCQRFEIYHYTTNIGEKALIKDDSQLWPLFGIDYDIDDSQ